MSALMTERIRLVILTDEELRDALQLRAAKRRKNQSDMADEILRRELAPEIAELRDQPPDHDEPKPPRKGK